MKGQGICQLVLIFHPAERDAHRNISASWFGVCLRYSAGATFEVAVPLVAKDGQDRQQIAMDVHGMSRGARVFIHPLVHSVLHRLSQNTSPSLSHAPSHTPPHYAAPTPPPSASSRDEEEKEGTREEWGGGEWRGYNSSSNIGKAAPAPPFLPTCQHRHPPPPPPRPPTPRP